MLNMKKAQYYSLILSRISLSLVFLWFGINQLIDQEDFMGYLPGFLLNTDFAREIIILNGIFDTFGGAVLMIGWRIKQVSLLLMGHLILTIISLGYNDIAVRDFGLMVETVAIFLGGADPWSLDYRMKR